LGRIEEQANEDAKFLYKRLGIKGDVDEGIVELLAQIRAESMVDGMRWFAEALAESIGEAPLENDGEQQ